MAPHRRGAAHACAQGFCLIRRGRHARIPPDWDDTICYVRARRIIPCKKYKPQNNFATKNERTRPFFVFLRSPYICIITCLYYAVNSYSINIIRYIYIDISYLYIV